MADTDDRIAKLIQQYIADHDGHHPDGRELYEYAIIHDEDLAEEIWAEDPTVSISDAQWESHGSRHDDEKGE